MGATDGTFGNQNNRSQTQPFLPLVRLSFACCPGRICPRPLQPFWARSWTRYLQADQTPGVGKSTEGKEVWPLGTHFACRGPGEHSLGLVRSRRSPGARLCCPGNWVGSCPSSYKAYWSRLSQQGIRMDDGYTQFQTMKSKVCWFSFDDIVSNNNNKIEPRISNKNKKREKK